MTAPDAQIPDARAADGISGRLFIQAIRRHPLLFTTIVLLTALAGAAIWYTLPLPRNTGAVVFHVAAQPPTVLGPTAEARVDFNTYRQTQAALVKKRQVLTAAVRQPAVAALPIVRSQSDSVAWLEQSLVVDFRSGPEVMRVTLEGNDPDQLRTILAAVARSYLDEVDEQENGQRRSRLEKLTEAQREHQNRLDGFQKQIDGIALRLGSNDGTTLALLDQMTREELGHANRDLADIEAQLQAAVPPKPVAPKEATVPAGLVDERLRRDPGIAQLEADAARAHERVVELERLLKPGATTPALNRARDDAKAADDRLARTKAELRPKLEATILAERREAAEKADTAAADEAARLKKRQLAISNRIEEMRTKIGTNTRARIELENLKSQAGHMDKLGASLSDEIDRLRVELGASPRVTLAEEPYALSGIEGNRRMKMTLLAVVGLFLAGYGGLVAWEYKTRRVTHVRDAANGLGLRLLGTVPSIGRNSRYVGDDPQRALAEAIDTTRTLLLYGAADLRVRTLVVTSAVDGEGKTSLAGHLAISLTRAGYRTLLVDGDVQAPSAHAVFNLPAAPGLCEVLRGDAAAREAVHPTGLPGLSVLPAGAWDLAARQALAGDRWRAVKSELEADFDFVVVDSGPVLFVSDSLLMARGADGVLLSVLLDVSRVSSVEETRDRLRAVGANVLGVVVNGVVTPAYRSIQARGPTSGRADAAVALPA
jgi:polysaccharide biosynthesis transport protein